jgi:3-oxoacyl-[acyl-carrier-protein] synthase III
MGGTPLGMLGFGFHLFEPLSIAETAAARGGWFDGYRGFKSFCKAGVDDRPSTMAAAAADVAIIDATINRSQIDLVIYVGTSKDHSGAFSVAAEVIRHLELGPNVVGFDVMYGCGGVLPALEIAQSWLATRGGGYALIVSAEKWSHTVPRDNPDLWFLWYYSDGAAAVVVGSNPARAATTFVSGVYRNRSRYTRRVVIDESASLRKIIDSPPQATVRKDYVSSIKEVIEEALERSRTQPRFVVSTQMTPEIMREIGAIAGVAEDNVVISADDVGHLGAGDVLLGLSRLKQADLLFTNDVLGVFHTPWACGATVFRPVRS